MTNRQDPRSVILTKKERKAIVQAFREELLGTPEARILALEKQVLELQQWPDQFRAALRDRVRTWDKP